MSERAQSRAWLGLGSNVGDRAGSIAAALKHLAEHPRIRIVAASSLYESAPWGDTDQGPFLNAAAEVETMLAPHALLNACLAVEAELGRVRERRWGPRVIDIDLIHVDGVSLSDERLTLPHPYWRERAFVLAPLAEIAPELAIAGTRVADALTRLEGVGVSRIGPA